MYVCVYVDEMLLSKPSFVTAWMPDLDLQTLKHMQCFTIILFLTLIIRKGIHIL